MALRHALLGPDGRRMLTDEVTTRTARIILDPGRHLFHLTVTPGAEVELADAEENLAHIPNEGRWGVLVDSRGLKSMSAAARRRYGVHTGGAVALAIVIDSPVSRIIGNFFLRFNSPAYPSRLFTDIDAARAWLEELYFLPASTS